VRLLGQRDVVARGSQATAGLGRSASVLAVASLSIGSISFALIFVGSRLLSSEDMAELLTLWAIMNTTVLSLIIPLETLAPRILAGTAGTPPDPSASFALVAHGALLGVVGGLVSVIVYAVASGIGEPALAVAGLTYCLGLGVWSGMRARLVGAGSFGQAMGLALITTAVALAAIGAAYILEVESGWLLLGAIAVAYLLGLVGWWLWAHTGVARPDRSAQARRWSLGRDSYRMLVTLIAVTFATLILNNGGLVVAGFLAIDARTVVVYAAALNLVRIPLMLINNVTPPINLRMVQLAGDFELAELRGLAVKTLVGFASVLGLGLVATWLLGPFFVHFLVGGESDVAGRFVALVLLGEGLIWLTVLPRIVCVAVGNRRVMVAAWTAGLASFVTWMFLPISNDWKVVGGPIVGGLVTLVFGLVLVARLVSPSRRALSRPVGGAMPSN
jgi:O-antigen/teichoic acid export membrane protein